MLLKRQLKRYLPLSLKLGMAMTSALVVSVVVVSVLSLNREQEAYRSEFENQAALLLDVLTASASDALYDLNTDQLNAITGALGEINSIVSGRFYGPDGRIIADASNPDAAFGLQADPLGAQFVQSEGVVFIWQADQLLAGKAIIIGHQRVGALSIGLSTASLPGKIEAVRNQGALVAIGAICVGLLMSWRLSLSIVKPLRRLTTATQQISQGDLNQQLDIRSRDEFAMLGEAFNSMVYQIRAMLAHEEDQRTTLAAANRHLEHTLSELTNAERKQDQLTATIRALSIPILNVAPGIVLAPLIGDIDQARSDQLLNQVLEYVGSWHARIIILDVTGAMIFDNAAAHTIINTALAARLLGAQTILCGIRPDLAETIISQDLGIDNIIVSTNLHSAISRAMKHLSASTIVAA